MKLSVFLTAVCALASALLVACGGVPLSSMPRLMALQGELLSANPAEFMLAIQTDESLVPPPGSTPTLNIDIRPREEGAFERVERKLPMRVAVAAAPAGVPRAGSGRRWMVYSFDAESQAELARFQSSFKRIQAERQGKSGGSLSVGIAQDGLAADDPRLAATRWESWLQTKRQAGFYELWSGTLGELKAQAANAAKAEKAAAAAAR